MTAPNYATVIVKLSSEIDLLTQTFVYQGYQKLAYFLKAPLGSLCILYIVLLGYGIVCGFIKTPMPLFIKSAVRIGLIYLLAMNWGFFSQYMADFFIKGVSELGALMMTILPAKLPALANIGGVNGGLQSVFIEVIRVGNWVWDTASFRHLGPFFTAIMVYLAGFAVVGLAFFELIVAKLMLSLCLATAPLFFLLTLFDKTRSFFDRWLGKLVGFSLVIFFVSTVVGFCLHLLHWAVSAHYLTHAKQFASVDWIPLLICASLGVMAILEVVGMAKNIGGSCSTATGSAMVGGFLGGAMGSVAAGSGVTKGLGHQTARSARSLVSYAAKASEIGGTLNEVKTWGSSRIRAIRQRLRGQKG